MLTTDAPDVLRYLDLSQVGPESVDHTIVSINPSLHKTTGSMTPTKQNPKQEFPWFARQRMLVSLVIFLLFVAAIWAFTAYAQHRGFHWEDWALGTDQKNAKYCELTNWDATLRQKMNSWSSLVFALAASWVLATALAFRNFIESNGPLSSTQTQSLVWTILLALSGYALAIGSFFFHASLTMAGQKADMGGAYAILITLIFIFIQLRLHESSAKKFLIHLLLIWSACVLLTLKLTEFAAGPYLVPILVTTLLVLRFRSRNTMPAATSSKDRSPHLLEMISLVALLSAVAFFLLDVQKISCCPSCIFQFHSLWHFAIALAYGCYAEFIFHRFCLRSLPST